MATILFLHELTTLPSCSFKNNCTSWGTSSTSCKCSWGLHLSSKLDPILIILPQQRRAILQMLHVYPSISHGESLKISREAFLISNRTLSFPAKHQALALKAIIPAILMLREVHAEQFKILCIVQPHSSVYCSPVVFAQNIPLEGHISPQSFSSYTTHSLGHKSRSFSKSIWTSNITCRYICSIPVLSMRAPCFSVQHATGRHPKISNPEILCMPSVFHNCSPIQSSQLGFGGHISRG